MSSPSSSPPPPPPELPSRWLTRVEALSRTVARDPLDGRAEFEALAAPLYHDLAREELAALVRDPAHGLERRFAGNLWVLFADPEITLTLALVTEPDSALVSSLPQHVSVAAVGPGQISVEHYRTDVSADARDTLAPDHRIVHQGTHVLVEGRALHLHAGTDVLRFAEVPQATPIMSLTAQRTTVRLTWDYDTRTLRPISCSLVESTASQLVFLLGVVAAQGRTDHLAFVERATRHPAHAVRWAAIKALWQLDTGVALAATRASLADAHPHVRRAAEKTLDLFAHQPAQEAAVCRSI